MVMDPSILAQLQVSEILASWVRSPCQPKESRQARSDFFLGREVGAALSLSGAHRGLG